MENIPEYLKVEGTVITGVEKKSRNKIKRIVIPEGITEIETWAFAYCENLESVEIPASITSIGGYAFCGCKSLVNVNIPVNVASIGSSAFQGCESLANIKIPVGIESIGFFAFEGCESLASIKIPVSVTHIGLFAFDGCKSLEIAEYNGTLTQWCALNGGGWLTSVAKSMILVGENNLDLKKQTTLTIPEGIASIGTYAFEGCERLESVNIPESITSIGQGAFDECENLEIAEYGGTLAQWCALDGGGYLTISAKSMILAGENNMDLKAQKTLKIPESVAYIGHHTFLGCYKNLKSVAIPASVTSIGGYAFGFCKNIEANYSGTLTQWCVLNGGGWLTSVAKSVILVGENNVDLKKQTTLTIPENVTIIGDHAFSGCKSLVDVKIPESITKIGNSAFAYCESLASIVIPKNVTSIGDYAFGDCKNLASVAIPEGVTSIGEYAFTACKSLASVAIPEGVTSISNGMFDGCKKLKSVELPASITSIGVYAFSGCKKLVNVKIPESVTEIGNSAFAYCESLASIAIPEGVTSIGEYTFRECKRLASATIPASITCISENMFDKCKSLASVTISDGIARIGELAFADCESIESVEIPASITSIGFFAFYGCKSLKSVNYGGTKEQWKQIQIVRLGTSSKFVVHCTDGDIIEVGDLMGNVSKDLKVEGTVVTGIEKESKDKIERIVIPEGITAIGEYAFMWCDKLKEITIPRSVKNIGEGAFCWCTSLETVRYDGTIEQWYEIDDDSLMVTLADRVLLCDETDIKALTEIVVPEGMTKIGKGTFYGCFSLGRVVLPESLVSLPSDTFFNGSTLKAKFGGTKEQWLALGNNDFTSVECKDGVVGINDIPPYLIICGSQMNGFTKEIPNAIVIPEGVTAINAVEPEEKKYQFTEVVTFEGVEEKNVEEKYELKEVTIPASVKYIEEGAFYGFEKIRTIRYGGTLAQWCAMDNDSSLMNDASINMEASDNDENIPYMHIILSDGTDIKALKNLVIPEGVTEIGVNALSFFDLESITIPASVTKIKYNALYFWWEAMTVRYSGTFEQWCALDNESFFVHFAKHIFLGDGTDIKTLKEIVIPEGMTKIGEGAFYSCPLLERVVLPESLESRPSGTFSNSSTLKAQFGGTKEQWLALGNDDFTSVECKDGTVDIGNFPPYFVMKGNRITDFREDTPSKLVIPEGVASIHVIHLREYIEDDSEERIIPENKPCSITDITIPTSVKYIGRYHTYFEELKTVRYSGTLAQWCDLYTLFSFAKKAEHIFLCDGTDIKALEEIAIPEGVRIVKGNAFREFTRLKSIMLPTSVTKIGRLAFCECESLESILIPCKVVEIDNNAFYMCAALTSVAIPSSVKKIGGNAFSHCPKLKDVRYDGTKEQWGKIMKYENFKDGVTIHCSDGDIVL